MIDRPEGDLHVLDAANSIAAEFVRARLTAASLAEYPGTVPASLAEAYACQDVAIGCWPDRICGWKVARIPRSWQAQFHEERLVGPIFRRNFHTSDADHSSSAGESTACQIFQDGFAAIEVEIGIVMGRAPPADKTQWTVAEAAELVERICIGAEIASSPLATLNDLGPGAVISDFGNNWGAIAGASIPDWRTRPRQIQCGAFINERSVGQAAVNFPDDALAAFAFALGKAARRGRPLRAGAYISTGMITGVHPLRVGDRARLTFEDCGEIICHAVQATPWLPESAQPLERRA
jgi:2-keto-4-pentenoate hydratase